TACFNFLFRFLLFFFRLFFFRCFFFLLLFPFLFGISFFATFTGLSGTSSDDVSEISKLVFLFHELTLASSILYLEHHLCHDQHLFLPPPLPRPRPLVVSFAFFLPEPASCISSYVSHSPSAI